MLFMVSIIAGASLAVCWIPPPTPINYQCESMDEVDDNNDTLTGSVSDARYLDNDHWYMLTNGFGRIDLEVEYDHWESINEVRISVAIGTYDPDWYFTVSFNGITYRYDEDKDMRGAGDEIIISGLNDVTDDHIIFRLYSDNVVGPEFIKIDRILITDTGIY